MFNTVEIIIHNIFTVQSWVYGSGGLSLAFNLLLEEVKNQNNE